MKYKVAVVGATGNVGRQILNVLYERNFPISQLIAIGSDRSTPKKVSFGDDVLEVQPLSYYNFAGTDIALFSAGAAVSRQYAGIAAKSGCVVIDNSSCFRMDDDIPLVVPEVNLDKLRDYSNKNIVANPNCAVLQMVVALKPLNDYAKIKRIIVSTYQSVSGAGKKAMDELFYQTKSKFFNQNVQPVHFQRQIAFNIIPQIGEFLEGGYSSEEWKMIVETQKIFDQEIDVIPTCVRVPVFIGHSESVTVEFEEHITPEIAHELLANAPSVKLCAEDNYNTPIECIGDYSVFVSRIRGCGNSRICNYNTISMWVVSDNLRKGAALNAVQIAEELINGYL